MWWNIIVMHTHQHLTDCWYKMYMYIPSTYWTEIDPLRTRVDKHATSSFQSGNSRVKGGTLGSEWKETYQSPLILLNKTTEMLLIDQTAQFGKFVCTYDPNIATIHIYLMWRIIIQAGHDFDICLLPLHQLHYKVCYDMLWVAFDLLLIKITSYLKILAIHSHTYWHYLLRSTCATVIDVPCVPLRKPQVDFAML